MDENTGQRFKNLKELKIGAGSTQFKADGNGIHLGAEKFEDATFSVDMQGSGKFTGQVTITGGSGIANLTDAGYLAALDQVGTGQLDSTVISGGKVVTGLLTADNIQTGTLSADRIATSSISGVKLTDGTVSAVKISSINADTITAGTITGRTLRTAAPAGGVGNSVVITGGNNQNVNFYYNADLRGYIGGYTTEGSEITYIRIEAASGRNLRFKNSKIECDGDFVPTSDEAYNCGRPNEKWNNMYAQTLWQQTNTNGSRQVYDFAYVEMNLLPKRLINKRLKGKDGCVMTNGYVPGLELPFKKGTVLKWTAKGLKESEKETDFVIAIADEKGLPIVLGAEPVRVIGKAKIGDYIVPSGIKGCAKATRKPIGDVIGRCLKSKKTEKEGEVLVMIKF